MRWDVHTNFECPRYIMALLVGERPNEIGHPAISTAATMVNVNLHLVEVTTLNS